MTHGTIEDFQYVYTPDNLIAGIGSLYSATQLPMAKMASVPNQTDQISQFGNAGYSFEDKGQTTTKTDSTGATSYNWDSRGIMTSAALPNGQVVNYSYDVLSRRNSRTTSGATTNFVYDGADVIQDKKGTNQTNYLNGGLDDKLRVSSTQTGSLYFLTDHLGSTQGLTGASGNVAQWHSYTPFGESNVSSTPTRYSNTGREKENDSGLIYYRSRWYDAQQGRFLSQDPISFSGGNTNLYAYVSNNPVSKTDPFGLYEIDVHLDLTEYLARKTGCFTDAQARAIGDADQGTDTDPTTSPGLGKTYQNAVYHALNHQSYEGKGSAGLMLAAEFGGLKELGISLHYLQDTFSHAGYSDSYYGHLGLSDSGERGLDSVNKTATDVSKTLRMAGATFRALKDWAKQKCNCKGNNSDSDSFDRIRRFAKVDTGIFSSVASIDGYIGP